MVVVRYILDVVHHGMETAFAEGAFLETALFGTIASSDDMREGTRVFLEKCKLVWMGR